MKVAFVTNLSTHYVKQLFEILSGQHDIDFYFTGGYEQYWNKGNRAVPGNFKSHYLNGLMLGEKFKLTPALFALPFKGYEAYVKTIDDRFALLATFSIAKLTFKPFILWAGLWHHPKKGVHRLTQPLMNFIYRHSNAVVVYGEHIKRYLVGSGVDPKRIFVAPHAVDNSQFDQKYSSLEKESIRKSLGLMAGPVVLFVGRLEECKGVDYLFDAFKKISDPDVNLIVVGNGPKKEELSQAKQGLKVHCHMVDHVLNEELRKFYAIADIFILPSITTDDFKEPWGLVVNEAMNQGCVVVATDAVGAAAGGLIENGVTGFVVPERNSDAILSAVQKLLKDDLMRDRMGRASKEKIVSWTHEKMAENFFQAFELVRR